MINGKIDLRSDTVTVPTQKMRDIMYKAEVGDDVYGDDPTVSKLEALTARMFGKEAAIYVPSGVMSNQLALFTHVQRGQEIILPDNCHVVQHEGGAAAYICGGQFRCIQPINGEMDLTVVEKSIRKDPEDIHQTSTALITYENADSDGQVRSVEYMAKVKALADKYGIPVHIDGARIFNAAQVLGVDVKELAPYFDTISVCLSKGLCAPVGSVLVGSNEFIKKAIRKRKILGGGMRQCGIIAAAGIVALEEMTDRLKEDHDNAKYMAERLSEVEGITVFKDLVQINMVFFKLDGYKLNSHELVEYMKKNDVIINGEDNGTMRFVTHNYVDKVEIDKVVELMKRA
ncbi:MAG: low-specificity L-threonine aldolase [Lachnospiraceae bacterium]|nr:low-specificity L-threonine aldolase [Lachnospiraceae bacterium]